MVLFPSLKGQQVSEKEVKSFECLYSFQLHLPVRFSPRTLFFPIKEKVENTANIPSRLFDILSHAPKRA